MQQAAQRGRRVMWFLVRVGFWLSLVILLLPTGESKSVAEGPQIGAVDAISAAGAAVSDARQFCVRQPEACAVGSQALTAFGHKAQAATKMAYEFLTEKLKADPAAAVATDETAKEIPADARAPAGTLTPADRLPPYRSPIERRDMVAARN